MKNLKQIFTVSICAVMVLLSSVVSGAEPARNPAPAEKKETVSTEKVNAARFLNMLNHNSNYNEDFKDIDTMVNNSVLNLLDLRDEENDEYIRSSYVVDYVKDMYGIEITDVSGLNADFPHMDGYIYILPRCIITYSHKFVSYDINEDSSITVYTDVTVNNGELNTYECVSLFVPNTESAFGYSLINSDISYPAPVI